MKLSRNLPNLRGSNSAYDTALDKLIAENRERLIRESVPNEEVRSKLLQINKLIEEIERIDPGTVGAWGGGCGAGCLTDLPGEMTTLRPSG